MSNQTKTQMRLFFKNKRDSVDSEVRSIKSKRIFKLVSEYMINCDNCETFFVYQSFASEVQTGEYIKFLINSGKKVLIPHCDINSETMQAAVYNSDKKQTKNAYGILELDEPDFFNEKIDVMVVPGISFDRFGNRIGFGKGYYDKFIGSLKTKPLLVGVCYSEQMCDEKIPSDDFDVKMDVIITDTEILEIRE